MGDESRRDHSAPTLAQLLGRGAPRFPDRDSLEAWGRALGAALPRPIVVTLAGDLGAGKTTLVRALCDGIGVVDQAAVTSPTFALMQEYDVPDGPVIHVDLYRLRDPRELETIGWDEVVATARVLLIEWPDRMSAAPPTATIAIELRHDPEQPDRRMLSVRGPAGLGDGKV